MALKKRRGEILIRQLQVLERQLNLTEATTSRVLKYNDKTVQQAPPAISFVRILIREIVRVRNDTRNYAT